MEFETNSDGIIFPFVNGKDSGANWIGYKNGYMIRAYSKPAPWRDYYFYATRNFSFSIKENEITTFFKYIGEEDAQEVWKARIDNIDEFREVFLSLMRVSTVKNANCEEVVLEFPPLFLNKGYDAIFHRDNILMTVKDGKESYIKSPDVAIKSHELYDFSLIVSPISDNCEFSNILVSPDYGCSQSPEVVKGYFDILYRNFIKLISL
jgi:hypothetical protein